MKFTDSFMKTHFTTFEGVTLNIYESKFTFVWRPTSYGTNRRDEHVSGIINYSKKNP